MASDLELDLIFHALGDSTRRRILVLLGRGVSRVSELAVPFDISLNAISKHIKVLERARLVGRRKLGREHYIHLNAKRCQMAQRWLEKQQCFWSAALGAMEKELKQEDRT